MQLAQALMQLETAGIVAADIGFGESHDKYLIVNVISTLII